MQDSADQNSGFIVRINSFFYFDLFMYLYWRFCQIEQILKDTDIYICYWLKYCQNWLENIIFLTDKLMKQVIFVLHGEVSRQSERTAWNRMLWVWSLSSDNWKFR